LTPDYSSGTSPGQSETTFGAELVQPLGQFDQASEIRPLRQLRTGSSSHAEQFAPIARFRLIPVAVCREDLEIKRLSQNLGGLRRDRGGLKRYRRPLEGSSKLDSADALRADASRRAA
jgi:hypothetical protein